MQEVCQERPTLDESHELIFQKYHSLLVELEELMPEDFEAHAYITGQLKGIKYVIDILAKTRFF